MCGFGGGGGGGGVGYGSIGPQVSREQALATYYGQAPTSATATNTTPVATATAPRVSPAAAAQIIRRPDQQRMTLGNMPATPQQSIKSTLLGQ